ncbi:uncharacterized protein LOC135137306 [Zophobas morio]|uniref:uncharacterized protein LOC135137306 n=1 Tax=Zophobas morio TaxID=2755281 RepID=UPI003083EDF1
MTTPDFDKHLDVLREVFRYVVKRSGLDVDPGKIEPILTLLAPKPVSEVRRIIGMASWYFRYIPNFAFIVAPITALLKKDRKFEWSDVCTVAFDTTKQNRTLLNLKVSWMADAILKSTVTTRPAISHTVVSHFVRRSQAKTKFIKFWWDVWITTVWGQ